MQKIANFMLALLLLLPLLLPLNSGSENKSADTRMSLNSSTFRMYFDMIPELKYRVSTVQQSQSNTCNNPHLNSKRFFSPRKPFLLKNGSLS